MKLIDFQVIAKKIIVGIIVFLVPLVILAGGLTLIKTFLN
jgi:hypothetical protein